MIAPRISIITPSYQQGSFIEETLLSVKGQDYRNVEHIVIDNLSTDNTQEILKKYESLYTLKWISEKDSGQSEAINKGFIRATGDIFGWINSDDVYMPGAFSKVAECFAKNPEINWIYGDAYWIDWEGNVNGIYKSMDFDLSSLAYQGMYIPQPTIFVKRELLDSVGYIDENIHTAMDYDYCLRLGTTGRAKYIPEIIAARRLHSNSKSMKARASFYYDALTCLDKFFSNKDLPADILSIRKRAVGNRHRVGGYDLFMDKKFRLSIDALIKALRSGCPFSVFELASIALLLCESVLHVQWIKPGLSRRIKNLKDKIGHKRVRVRWQTN